MAINVEANNLLNAEISQWSATDVLTLARRLPMPCWFIHGQADPRPASTVADLARVIPDSQVHIVNEAGHEPWRERPAELRELLSRLLSAVAEQASPTHLPVRDSVSMVAGM